MSSQMGRARATSLNDRRCVASPGVVAPKKRRLVGSGKRCHSRCRSQDVFADGFPSGAGIAQQDRRGPRNRLMTSAWQVVHANRVCGQEHTSRQPLRQAQGGRGSRVRRSTGTAAHARLRSGPRRRDRGRGVGSDVSPREKIRSAPPRLPRGKSNGRTTGSRDSAAGPGTCRPTTNGTQKE